MKTEEDEAFDELAKRQGDWGGGFKAKQAMAADKLQEPVPLYVSKPALEGWRGFASDYERGFIDGMKKQAQSSVDKAVNQMAQPTQEPVAWMVYTQDGQSVYVTDNPTDIQEGQRALPLYTAPPQPAQESQDIASLVEGMEVSVDVSTGEHDSGNRLFGTVTLAQENQSSKHGLILLVQEPAPNFKTTTPPQREWADLTYEDWKKIENMPDTFYQGVAWAQVKLKEKNG